MPQYHGRLTADAIGVKTNIYDTSKLALFFFCSVCRVLSIIMTHEMKSLKVSRHSVCRKDVPRILLELGVYLVCGHT